VPMAHPLTQGNNMIKTWQQLKELSNGQWPDEDCMKEEIAQLRAENAKLRDALKPFARAYLNYTIENVDAARAALGDGK